MGGVEGCTGFWWGNMRERDHWGDPGVDGRIILRWIFGKWDCEGMNWIGLAQDRDRWWALQDGRFNHQHRDISVQKRLNRSV
jgi:hypothetical protein